MKDYYKVLGIPRSATSDQIKQAYRKLIKGCHPDVTDNPKAAEWTRELNEANSTLSDAKAKMSYDMDLKLEESKQRQASARQTTTNQSRAESRSPPRAEPDYCCEQCNRTDSSLRISATWRVESLYTYSKKSPTVKILCGKCRVKESLAASLYTVILGWWGIPGFIWTLEALFNNARGGEQPVDNNVALLNAVGYILYRADRHQEAYEATLAAYRLKPDPKTEQLLKQLLQQTHPLQRKPFWERCWNLNLHPGFYHASVGVALGLVGFGFYALYTILVSGSFPARQSSPVTVASHHNSTPQPVFSEPEQLLPEQGSILVAGDAMYTYTGVRAPLKITTRASDGNYLMKIEDWSTKELLLIAFISRGSTASFELPLGSYRLKFASGDKWYGTDHRFGPSTAYSYVPNKMDFTLSGDHTNGHRIELIPQVGGNLKTPRMNANAW